MSSFRIGNRDIIGERETWVLLLRAVFGSRIWMKEKMSSSKEKRVWIWVMAVLVISFNSDDLRNLLSK
jgi:membrane-anchored protein YejM (alkaline phosphatase superfamily)